MKKFPYKFTPWIITLFIAGFVVATAVIVLNIVKFATTENPDTYSYITLISTVSIAIVAIVFCIAILVASNFIVDDEHLTLRWGFVANKIKIVSITKLIKLDNSNKLMVHYNENEYMVVFINPLIFDEFSSYLVSKNKDIIIEYTNG